MKRFKLNVLQTQRENNLTTVPSTIAEEKNINPFMRLRFVHIANIIDGHLYQYMISKAWLYIKIIYKYNSWSM